MARKRTARKNADEIPWNDRFVFKYGSKMLLGITVILVFLTLAQCTVKKPEAPEWDTRLTVPVINRTYGMEELVTKLDQDELGFDQDGNVTFTVSEDLDTVRLDADVLTTDDLSYGVSESLGEVAIEPPVIAPVSVSLAAITGLAAGQPGDSADVNATSFDLYNGLETINSVTQMTIAVGSAIAVVDNNLGVDLDTVVIQIYDVTNAAVVASGAFPAPIASGQTDSLSLPLSGATVSNTLRVDAHCYTPGGTIDSYSSRYISTGLVFEDSLTVTSAVAEIPALSKNFTQQIDLSETNRIDTAVLSDGQLTLTITNNTNLGADISISLPDVIIDGSPLTLDTTLLPQQQLQLNRDLADGRLVPGGSSVPQQVDIEVTADAPGSGGQHIAVDQDDFFDVQAELTSLSFASLTGLFDNTDATFDAESFDIDIPTGFDSLELVTAVLTLDIENGTGLPGYLDIQLLGDNGKSLTLTGDIAPGASDAPVTTTITNGNIAAFMSPLPSNVAATGTVTYGDGVTPSTVTVNDFVFSRVGIVAPLEIILHESRIETDIEHEEIDQENINQITDHVNELGFFYNIVNHLPLGATVEIMISPDSATLYSNPRLAIGPVTIEAAPVSPAGLVIDTASSGYHEMVLPHEAIQILKHDTLYVGQVILLHGSSGQSVRLVQSDYITVTGRFEVDYHFDGEF